MGAAVTIAGQGTFVNIGPPEGALARRRTRAPKASGGHNRGSGDTSQPGKAELRRLFGPSSEALPKAGAKLVTVPELVGVPSGPSTRTLQSRGLYLSARFPGRIGNAQLKPECGYTFSHQSPAAGTRVPKGSTVVAVSDLCPKFKRKPHRGSGPD